MNSIASEAEANETEYDNWLDDEIQVDPDHPVFQETNWWNIFTNAFAKLYKFSVLRDAKKQEKALDPAVLRKAFGTIDEREFLAGKIRLLLAANSHLATDMINEMKLEISSLDLKLKQPAFEVDDKGISKLMLYRLPKHVLMRQLANMEAWATADPKNWDKAYYRMIRLGWTPTKKLRMTENSGAYAKVWEATQEFADNQGTLIDQFMNPEELSEKDMIDVIDEEGNVVKRPPRTRGMSGIVSAIEGIWDFLTEQQKNEYVKGGFFGGRSIGLAKQNLVELFTWAMHGRIENIDAERAQKKDKKGNLIFEHGPGVYIYLHNRPTGVVKDGNVMFGWQKPVPLKYDPAIHGTDDNVSEIFRDSHGIRRDTYNIIKNGVPLNDAMWAEMNSLISEARTITKEAFHTINARSELAFNNILRALTEHFPNKTLKQIKQAIVFNNFEDANGRDIWSAEELAQLEYLEENFTKWSLEAPFMANAAQADFKQNYWPYIYMPESYALLLQDSIDSINTAIEDLEDSLETAEGEDYGVMVDELAALEAALINQKDMQTKMMDMDVDQYDESKMVTRSQSKHFKHITNALDVLKSRTDTGVFRSYLEHSARSIERNNLTAELIRAMTMTKETGIRDAFVSLYRGALGRGDARSLFLGMDLTDDNMNPKVIRGAKIVRKLWNTMLAGPTTAARQAFGHIEKYNKQGMFNTLEAWAIMKAHGQELERLFQESGVVVFDDFFTNSIVQQLEKMDADKRTINAMVAEYVKHFKRIDKGANPTESLKTMQTKLTALFNRPMNWEAILTKDEAKNFNKKLKAQKIQDITNKITAWSINNQGTLQEAFRQTRLREITGMGFDALSAARTFLGRAAIMSEMEIHLRKTSFILGIRMAMRNGAIKSMPIHKLRGAERKRAIKVGRKATNLMFDFSMSRQGVGEAYRGALGSLGGQFSVWKVQKASSDIDLIANAVRTFNDPNTPDAILKPLIGLSKAMLKTDAFLQRTNPDALRLKRWLKGQFLLEGAMQATLFLPFVPGIVKQIMFMTGARNLSAAGSPIAATIWGVFYMLGIAVFNSFGDDPWDEAQEIERYLTYHVRQIPGFGVGEGAIYDMTLLTLALIAEQEEIAKSKIGSMSSYIAPAPILRDVVREAIVKPALEEIY